MKKEYDFSKAQRGRFYRPKAKLNLPMSDTGSITAVRASIIADAKNRKK
jgi:hypothetical protein